MRFSSPLIAAALVLVFPMLGRADEPQNMAADFAWFASLGFPDVRGLKFCHFVVGWSTTGGETQMVPMWQDGWLLAEDEKSFKILTLDFRTFELSRSGKSRWEEHHFELEDFSRYVEAQLKRDDPDSESAKRVWPGPKFSERSNLFVLAWMCSRQGYDGLAAKAYAAAENSEPMHQGKRGMGSGTDADWPFRSKLDRDIGVYEIWKIILDFDDLKVTRKQLLARLEALPERYPHCDYLDLAEDMIAQLKIMIPEDDAHPPLTEEQIEKLTPAEQAKEWVFRLRDENARQFGQPGTVLFFVGYNPADPKPPTHRLDDLGDAAIPALIEALGDKRLTRSVGYGRNFFFSHRVLSVGDAALQTIERIAGRQFTRSGKVQGKMAQDGETDPVRVAVKAWWREHQSKGPMRELSDATARGDFSSAEAGAKLLKEFSNEAAEPILAGAAAARDEGAKCAFVGLVSRLRDERATSFLIKEARDGKFLGARAEAAERLASRNSFEGVEALAKDWKSSVPARENRVSLDRKKVIATLASANSPVGIRALAEGLRAKTPTCRNEVVTVLRPGGWSTAMSLLGDDSNMDPRKPEPERTPETQAAQEDLLAMELEDDGDPWFNGVFGLGGGDWLRNPRRCDFAAYSLAQWWPNKYVFDPLAPFAERERQRHILLNAYRAGKGLAAFPLPDPRPVVAPADAGKIAAVLSTSGQLNTPAPIPDLLRAAQGKTLDLAFYEKLRQSFLDACDGRKPRLDQGVVVIALREADQTGISLIVSPAERFPSAKSHERNWRIEVRADVDEKRSPLFGSEFLFVKPTSSQGRRETKTVFEKIEALSAETPFCLTIEIAPDRWEDDNAL